MKLDSLLLGVIYFMIGHVLVWFQLNGQFFKMDWFRKNEIIVACFGFFISFFYIWATKHTVESFNGLLWPARFIGFAIGILIYALFVAIFFNEGISMKTFISLMLCILLICIQVFYK
jgi:hypothetical protein